MACRDRWLSKAQLIHRCKSCHASSFAVWIESKSPSVGGRNIRRGVTIGIKWRIERLDWVAANRENEQALAGTRLPLHSPPQGAVDLPKVVQVMCRFQANELLDRLPSAYLVDPIALHPPCARDRFQQSQVALAQRPKDPCRKAHILLRVTQALCPYRLIPPR